LAVFSNFYRSIVDEAENKFKVSLG